MGFSIYCYDYSSAVFSQYLHYTGETLRLNTFSPNEDKLLA